MTAVMFASLNDSERRELAARLRRAGERLGDEANQLASTPEAVLASYHLPREGYHDFYSAAIECSMLSVEVWRRPAPDLTDVIAAMDPAGQGRVFVPERGDLIRKMPAFVPTGTGWPL